MREAERETPAEGEKEEGEKEEGEKEEGERERERERERHYRNTVKTYKITEPARHRKREGGRRRGGE